MSLNYKLAKCVWEGRDFSTMVRLKSLKWLHFNLQIPNKHTKRTFKEDIFVHTVFRLRSTPVFASQCLDKAVLYSFSSNFCKDRHGKHSRFIVTKVFKLF